MGRGRTVRRALGALLVVAALDASPARADLFCNAAAITINDAAVATPYPSTINVSGMTGGVTQLRVRILGLSHTFPDDIQLLLVGPGGQKMTMKDGPGAVEIVDSNGNSVKLETSGITVTASAKVTINASQVAVSAGLVTVDAGMSKFSGVVQADTVISNSVISASYTPGAGNIW